MSRVEYETNLKIIREHVEGYSHRNDAQLTVNLRGDTGGDEYLCVEELGVALVEIGIEEIDLGHALETIDQVLASFGMV